MSRKPTKVNAIRAERLKTLIKDLNITQTEFAKRVNYSQQHISGIINQKTALTEDTAEDIVNAFPNSCEIGWLLGHQDEKTQKERFFKAIHEADTEAQLLDNGFFSFAQLAGFNIDIAPVKSGDSVEDALHNIRSYCTVEKDDKKLTLSLEDLRKFENELCDYVELRLRHMMK